MLTKREIPKTVYIRFAFFVYRYWSGGEFVNQLLNHAALHLDGRSVKVCVEGSISKPGGRA